MGSSDKFFIILIVLCKIKSKMSYEEKYHEWIYQVAAIVHNKNKVDRRRKLIATVCISEYKFKKIY